MRHTICESLTVQLTEIGHTCPPRQQRWWSYNTFKMQHPSSPPTSLINLSRTHADPPTPSRPPTESYQDQLPSSSSCCPPACPLLLPLLLSLSSISPFFRPSSSISRDRMAKHPGNSAWRHVALATVLGERLGCGSEMHPSPVRPTT